MTAVAPGDSALTNTLPYSLLTEYKKESRAATGIPQFDELRAYIPEGYRIGTT